MHIILVGGLEHFLFFHILGILIIPIDYYFFREVQTTSQYICILYECIPISGRLNNNETTWHENDPNIQSATVPIWSMAFQAVQLEAGFAIDTRRGNDWFLGYLSGLVAAGDFSRKTVDIYYDFVDIYYMNDQFINVLNWCIPIVPSICCFVKNSLGKDATYVTDRTRKHMEQFIGKLFPHL